jgi:hypothetical protein
VSEISAIEENSTPQFKLFRIISFLANFFQEGLPIYCTKKGKNELFLEAKVFF